MSSDIPKTVYEPREDSYLLQDVFKNHLESLQDSSISILDMGSGSGILIKACIDSGFNNAIAVDINKDVINHLRSRNITAVNSDLFKNHKLKHKKFDLIIFNPPYLPENKDEPADSRLYTTAGKKGYELIVRFLSEARSHLKNDGKILLLFSSLSKPDIILRKAKSFGYYYKKKVSQKLFFEELFVYEFWEG